MALGIDLRGFFASPAVMPTSSVPAKANEAVTIASEKKLNERGHTDNCFDCSSRGCAKEWSSSFIPGIQTIILHDQDNCRNNDKETNGQNLHEREPEFSLSESFDRKAVQKDQGGEDYDNKDQRIDGFKPYGSKSMQILHTKSKETSACQEFDWKGSDPA
jgi:hypothetical protein